MRFSAVL